MADTKRALSPIDEAIAKIDRAIEGLDRIQRTIDAITGCRHPDLVELPYGSPAPPPSEPWKAN